MNSRFLCLAGWLAGFLAILSGPLCAQDLEPRRWSYLPTNLNVLGVATGWTDSDILFDPVLRIEDATSNVYVGAASYVRTFDFFGKSSRVDLLVPYASGRWEGLVDGVDTVVRRRGFADPRVRFSVLLYGAPPLSGKAYMQHRMEHPVMTTVGAAVAVTLPLGDYNDQKLINLSDNRFAIRPQIGVLHQRYKWQFELTGSVFLYQDNNDFLNGGELDQDPLWFVQGHVIYTFKPGWWASLSGGYAYGGRSWVNGAPKTDDRRTNYFAFSLGVPINQRQSLKFSYLTSQTNISVGSDSDAFVAAWSINWGR
jgi:hypothetical protein